MSNQSKYNAFRQTHPVFAFEGYEYDVQPDGLHIVFHFDIGGVDSFHPTAFIPSRSFLRFDQPKEVMDNLVFNIGMIELVSYWKCYCPPTIEVRCGTLDDEQIAFWKKIYYNGLGEFFYINGIEATMDNYVTILAPKPSAPQTSPLPLSPGNGSIALVPIGGGKDSVVTLELLGRKAGTDHRPTPLIMNPRGATIGCVEAAGYTMDDVLVIRRTIHPHLLELNAQGCLNGHTPFSAMLAFYTLLASRLSGISMVALSNEGSANESTVVGTSVNHQYSKSLEFENDFRHYAERYISPAHNYFSFLRPLSELQIGMLFSGFEHYFPVFKSCNVGSKQDIWCGHCAKCLFAYIILSPFIEPQKLDRVFGKCMLDDESLRLEFDQLTGRAETKPFECVGTISEVHSALALTIGRWYAQQRPALLRDYEPGFAATPLHTLSPEHNVPAEMEALLLPALFAHLRVLIAGYGREGKSTEAFLRAHLPVRQMDIAANDEEIFAALAQGPAYDVIFKSPGIPTMKLEGRCHLGSISSQTDLFLQLFHRQTIGITGTKGKSTTTKLIHHVLQQALPHRRVILAGNIGIPLLDIVDQIEADSLVVAELSCHQLENIQRAPHIAVMLNLYQEHLDHYHNYRDYQLAKAQIALKQLCEDDLCLWGMDSEDSKLLLLEGVPLQGKGNLDFVGYQYALDKGMDQLTTTLKGKHNLVNIYAAYRVAAQLGVSREQFAEALASFRGLPHRLELVGTYQGVTFYNDSISTIPEAAIAAMDSLPETDTLILGGFDRGIDYSPLGKYLAAHPDRARNIVFVGAAGRRMQQEWNASDPQTLERRTVLTEDNYAAIVPWCYQHTQPGRICLLSPAAASYDAFKNFEHRGQTFKELVEITSNSSNSSIARKSRIASTNNKQ